MFSSTEPSERSETLFSSAPGPTGSPCCQVSPWSSENAVTAKSSPSIRTTYCCRRRPACSPARSWIPAPEEANIPAQAGSFTRV